MEYQGTIAENLQTLPDGITEVAAQRLGERTFKFTSSVDARTRSCFIGELISPDNVVLTEFIAFADGDARASIRVQRQAEPVASIVSNRVLTAGEKFGTFLGNMFNEPKAEEPVAPQKDIAGRHLMAASTKDRYLVLSTQSDYPASITTLLNKLATEGYRLVAVSEDRLYLERTS